MTNENQNQINVELLPEDAEYKTIVSTAKELGINYIGVKKDDLLQQVNDYIKKINSGEVEIPVMDDTQDDIDENEDSQENESPAQAAAKKSARKQRERAQRVKAKKWYEEPGAFPYNEGDVVEIIGGKDLIGRKLHVLEPSAKKDMVKGRLIHPVSGELQKTVIAISFDRIKLVESATDNEPIDNQNLTEGSEEQINIPELNEAGTENNEQKAE